MHNKRTLPHAYSEHQAYKQVKLCLNQDEDVNGDSEGYQAHQVSSSYPHGNGTPSIAPALAGPELTDNSILTPSPTSNMPKAGEHTFLPLSDDPDAIRLLRVSASYPSGYIRCSLREAILGIDNYIALSHVWGENRPTCKVLLDEKAFWVRPQLWSFLNYAQKNLSDRDIWIDAMCINQDEAMEKNRQIPLMGRIFSQATKVIGWLCGTNDSMSAIDRVHFDAMISRQSLATTEEDGAGTRILARADVMASALMRLIEHEYWSRLWVVQELSLARKFEIHWESHIIQWAALKSLMSCVFGSGSLHNNLARVLSSQLASRQWRMDELPFFGFLKPASTAHGPNCLIDLMLQFEKQSCSVVHDRAFALLALANDVGDFQADYTASPLSVFAQIMINVVQYPSLEEVCHIGRLLHGQADESVTFDVPYRSNIDRLRTFVGEDVELYSSDDDSLRCCLCCWRGIGARSPLLAYRILDTGYFFVKITTDQNLFRGTGGVDLFLAIVRQHESGLVLHRHGTADLPDSYQAYARPSMSVGRLTLSFTWIGIARLLLAIRTANRQSLPPLCTNDAAWARAVPVKPDVLP